MTDFDSRLALVTGAMSGIGMATANLLSENGARVIGFDLSADESRSIMAVDVCDDIAVRNAVKEMQAKHGTIDILVNSAGVGSVGSFMDLELAEFDKLIQGNLRSALIVSKEVIPGMSEKGDGAIINIASTFGLVARKDYFSYGVSKAGLVHMTRSMAIELAQSGVRINCICPGLIETPMTGVLFKDDAKKVLAKDLDLHAMRRAGQPEEVAEAVCFLASDRASYITGIALPVDGGYTAGKWLASDLT